MTLAQSTGFRLVDDKVDFYRRHAESWKDAHDAAMACFEVEELLALGIAAFDSINRADEWLREQVVAGAEYDAGEDAKIEALYQKWLAGSALLAAILSQLEQRFEEVRGAEEFRRCYREVQGILTPDEEFFIHDALVRARDEAIDAHRRGETVEELSD